MLIKCTNNIDTISEVYNLRKVNTFYVGPQTIWTGLVIILPRRTFCPDKHFGPASILAWLYIFVVYI